MNKRIWVCSNAQFLWNYSELFQREFTNGDIYFAKIYRIITAHWYHWAVKFVYIFIFLDLPDFPRKRNHEHSGTSLNLVPPLYKYYIKWTVCDFPSKGVNSLYLLYLLINVEVFFKKPFLQRKQNWKQLVFTCYKHGYLNNTWSDNAWEGTVVNQVLPCVQGSLEISLTVPLY